MIKISAAACRCAHNGVVAKEDVTYLLRSYCTCCWSRFIADFAYIEYSNGLTAAFGKLRDIEAAYI